MKVFITYHLIPEEIRFAVQEMSEQEYNKWKVIHGVCVNVDKLTKEQNDVFDEFNNTFNDFTQLEVADTQDMTEVDKFLYVEFYL